MLVDIPNVTNSLRDLSCKREGDFTAFERTRLSLRNMARLLDHRPGLLVFVTGDGAGWARGDGMFAGPAPQRSRVGGRSARLG